MRYKNILYKLLVVFFLCSYIMQGKTIVETSKNSKGVLNMPFETLTPHTSLLWYTGFIGDIPITLMLKRTFNEATWDIKISEIAYAYDSKKEWIYLVDQEEFKNKRLQDGIYAIEKVNGEKTGSWAVRFFSDTTLEGIWYDEDGNVLPVKLIPMAKEIPDFHISVVPFSDLRTPEARANEDGARLDIYKNKNIVQSLTFDYCGPNFFDTAYVDVNYDGYLDLVVDSSVFIYNSETNLFNEKELELEGYGLFLFDLYQYNPYTKSVYVQNGRLRTEYRAVDDVLTPYESNSNWFNDDGNIVTTIQRYTDGKWEVVEEHIEHMEDLEEEIDISLPENYELDAGLNVYQDVIYFTPNLHNRTGLKIEFKEDAQLFVEVGPVNGTPKKHYLYDINLQGSAKDILNDNSILFDGKEYILSNWDGPIPFFPPNFTKHQYHFRLLLVHPLFGEIRSKTRTLNLPFSIKKAKNAIQLEGNINDKVHGKIYFVWNDTKVKATFINTKTNQRIKLSGTVIGERISLIEFEKDDEISGYFEGSYTDGVYSGQWLSTDRKISVPYKFE